MEYYKNNDIKVSFWRRLVGMTVRMLSDSPKIVRPAFLALLMTAILGLGIKAAEPNKCCIKQGQTSSVDCREKLDDEDFSQILPDTIHQIAHEDLGDKRYAEMDPVDIADFIFYAWKNEEWDKVRLFTDINSIIEEHMQSNPLARNKVRTFIDVNSILIDYMRANPLAGYKIYGWKFKIFSSWRYFVPYKLFFKNGDTKIFVLSLRNDNKMKRYVLDGGI